MWWWQISNPLVISSVVFRGEQAPEISAVPELSTPFDLTPQSDFSSQESLLLESKLLIQVSSLLFWYNQSTTEWSEAFAASLYKVFC